MKLQKFFWQNLVVLTLIMGFNIQVFAQYPLSPNNLPLIAQQGKTAFNNQANNQAKDEEQPVQAPSEATDNKPADSFDSLNAPANSPSENAAPAAPEEKTPNVPAAPEEEGGITLNAVDQDIRDLIKQIGKMTKKNFLIDPQVRGKVTIVSEKRMTEEEAYQAFLSALEVNGYTVLQAPGNLVKIIPTKGMLQRPLPIYKSDSPNTDAYITRLVQLRNISALEMSSAIKDLVSKEGNLFAYPATNTLIITDTGSNITRLLNIMKELDQEGPSESVQIIPLKYASASDVASKITELYETGGGAAAATRTATRRPTRATRGAVSSPELEETPYISKVVADERTNSVILLASKRAVAKVRQLVAQLDRKLEEGAQGKIHVHYLKHADAKEIAEVLSSLASGSGSAASRQSAAARSQAAARDANQSAAPISAVAEFEGGLKIAADENTNALIITATAKDYKTLSDEVIDKLDIPRKQVYVEVVIMELTVGNNRDVGVSGHGLGGISIGGQAASLFGSSLGGALSLSPSALTGLAAGVISQGTSTVPIDFGNGNVQDVEIPNFGAVLTAIQSDNNVNVLSTPNLLTMDNEEAEIIVGGEQPFPAGTTLSTTGSETFNITRENVGLTLKLTPQVNEGDTVKLKIKQEVSSVVPSDSEAVLTSLGPSTTKRSVETMVAAKDQQTIVIGGLINDRVVMNTTKVPFLGDIPILGHLFKRKQVVKDKTNLLVFLRPYIIRDTKDFLKILQKKVEERNMFIDQNYGSRQRKVIRQSIRTHSSDLLEFRKQIQEQEWDFKNNSTQVTPTHSNEPAGSTSSTDYNDQLIDAAKTEKP